MNGRAEERRAARRAVWLALLFSLLVHLSAVFTVAWFVLREPTVSPEPALEELTITMIEPPAPEKTRFVDSAAPESEPPENAAFESDRNTAAASPDAAQGGEAVPTQDGRDQSFLELEEQELALAKPDAAPPAPAMPPSSTAAAPAPPRSTSPTSRRGSTTASGRSGSTRGTSPRAACSCSRLAA